MAPSCASLRVKPAPTAAEAAAAAAAAEMAAAAAPACRRARVGVPAALKEQAESFLTNCVSLHSRLPRMSVAADDARAGLMPAALLAHNIAVSSLLRRLEPAAADAAPMQSQPIESAALQQMKLRALWLLGRSTPAAASSPTLALLQLARPTADDDAAAAAAERAGSAALAALLCASPPRLLVELLLIVGERQKAPALLLAVAAA